MADAEPRHVDDFIDDPSSHSYASFVLNWLRAPADHQARFAPFMSRFRLYCTHGGKRYRVTMASRLGDIGLSSDPNRNAGYELRVMPDECSNWRCEP